MSYLLKRLVMAVTVLFMVITLSNIGFAQTKTLRMANWVPPVHHMTLTLKNWIAEVDKATGGTLKINLLGPGLAKPPGQYDIVKNGVVDFAWGVAAYTPGRFPMMRVLELPFLSPNAETGSAGLWEWYEKHGFEKKEFSDTKLIALFVHGPGLLHSKKEIRTLEDLKGVKLRVGGGGVAMSDKLGAVPVAMSATKAHESLQRGITQGALFPWEAIKGFRLEKLVSYHLKVPGGLYTTPFFLIMNKKSWEMLSDEHKAALNKVSGHWGSRFIGKHWDAADKAGMKVAESTGNKISTIDPAELKRWSEKIQFITDDWIKKAGAAGYDGKALLEDLKKTIKKNE